MSCVIWRGKFTHTQSAEEGRSQNEIDRNFINFPSSSSHVKMHIWDKRENCVACGRKWFPRREKYIQRIYGLCEPFLKFHNVNKSNMFHINKLRIELEKKHRWMLKECDGIYGTALRKRDFWWEHKKNLAKRKMKKKLVFAGGQVFLNPHNKVEETMCVSAYYEPL